jgi:hypothetical protein
LQEKGKVVVRGSRLWIAIGLFSLHQAGLIIKDVLVRSFGRLKFPQIRTLEDHPNVSILVRIRRSPGSRVVTSTIIVVPGTLVVPAVVITIVSIIKRSNVLNSSSSEFIKLSLGEISPASYNRTVAGAVG